MGRGKIIGIILAVIIATGTGLFFLIGFLTYGTLQTSGSRSYAPVSTRSPEPIVIRTDIGNINVRYNTSATQFAAKVDYNIRMGGAYMIGKSISDFFLIEWDNVTSDITDKTSFILRRKPGVSLDPTNWFSVKRIEINVTLRTDIIYSIEEYATTGNVVNDIPSNVTVNSLTIETTTGNSLTKLDEVSLGSFIADATTGGLSVYAKNSNLTDIIADATTGNLKLNFSNCLINGDIDAKVTTGGLTFNSYNTRSLSNVNWDLDTTTGNINCDIIQYVEMGGNVVGDWTVTTGNINIDYIDGLSTVGASFSGTVDTGSINPTNSGGFEVLGTTLFRSLDLSSANYTFIFNLHTTTGNINIDGQSS
ncbi:MAG: hypothetical protein HWN81_19715 [Candidatus Lokiarchaeota archaeon]|nr:hypothetical protein [Candidatus Lokiarchaeota archaeon]